MDSLELPWLPPVANDFGQQVRALRQAQAFDAARFRKLATMRLNRLQLSTLARALPAADEAWPADRLRLRVLSNGTADFLLPALAATAPRHGLWLKPTTSAFGTYLQEALDPQSETHRSPSDVVLLALDHRAFDLIPTPGNLEAGRQRVDAALAQLQGMADALQRANECLVVLQTLAAPPGALFGNMDGQVPGTTGWLLDEFNRGLRVQRTASRPLLDVASLAATVGLERWHDPSLWSLGKIPFAQQAIPLYADHLCRVLMAVRGKSKKCLVLDLDNTVWGGVIGDDGLAGIVLGQGSPTGEAHLAVQQAALALRERGIVLAVSSKNEDAIARLPFREHPEMLLREEHIAAFQANWQDKAANLRAIASTLNIGVDALVLLDDNPAERHQVREALPEVGVPELPEQPEFFAPTLLAAGYFEAVQFTAEDLDRAAQYQANAARNVSLASGADLKEHLASLDMVAQASPFDEVGRARIAQLINKTNQFNLTTRRRTEAEVAALERDPAVQTLQVRLKDRFGDNGMISVVICLPDQDAWQIDTWLMSCRVLNRGVEQAVLNVLVDQARQRGVTRLVGRYLPTPKNALVQDHYRALGFTPRTSPDGTAEWVLELADHTDYETQIRMQFVAAPATEPKTERQ
jgi:FkbH-like protein